MIYKSYILTLSDTHLKCKNNSLWYYVLNEKIRAGVCVYVCFCNALVHYAASQEPFCLSPAPPARWYFLFLYFSSSHCLVIPSNLMLNLKRYFATRKKKVFWNWAANVIKCAVIFEKCTVWTEKKAKGSFFCPDRGKLTTTGMHCACRLARPQHCCPVGTGTSFNKHSSG